MPASTPAISPFLIRLAFGYRGAQNTMWRELFPIFPVRQESDKYFKLDEAGEEIKQRNIKMGPKDDHYPIMDSDWGQDTYSCEQYGLKGYFTERQRQNAVTPVQDPERATLMALLNNVEVNYEKIVRDFVVAQMTGGYAKTVPSGEEWSKFGANASDPIRDVAGWKETLLNNARIGGGNVEVVLALERAVLSKLKQHPLITARVTGGSTTDNPGVAVLNNIARILDVDRVVEIAPRINTAVPGSETPIITGVWSKEGMLFIRALDEGEKVFTFGRTFNWEWMDGIRSQVNAPNGSTAWRVKRWTNTESDKHWIATDAFLDSKIIAKDAALRLHGLIE